MISTPVMKRGVSIKATADKWLAEYNKLRSGLRTSYISDRDHMVALKRGVCSQFREKLELMRNYRTAFIEGTSNIHASTFKEHATTDMQTCAMALQQSSSVFDYAPITKAL